MHFGYNRSPENASVGHTTKLVMLCGWEGIRGPDDLFFEADSDVSPCPQGLLKDQSKVLVLVLVLVLTCSKVLVLVTQVFVNITLSGTFCSNFVCLGEIVKLEAEGQERRTSYWKGGSKL